MDHISPPHLPTDVIGARGMIRAWTDEEYTQQKGQVTNFSRNKVMGEKGSRQREKTDGGSYQ